MKPRVIVFSFISIIIFLLTACSKEGVTKDATTTVSSSIEISLENTTTPHTNKQTVEWIIDWKTFEQYDTSIVDDHYTPPQKREIYYILFTSFAAIAGREECDEWEDRFHTLYGWPDSTNEMLVVSYIKEFNITREQFDKANNEYYNFRISSGVGINNESHEIFNANLIYTFNNEKINDYYGRNLKKAKAADEWLQEWLETNEPYSSYVEYQQANAD